MADPSNFHPIPHRIMAIKKRVPDNGKLSYAARGLSATNKAAIWSIFGKTDVISVITKTNTTAIQTKMAHVLKNISHAFLVYPAVAGNTHNTTHKGINAQTKPIRTNESINLKGSETSISRCATAIPKPISHKAIFGKTTKKRSHCAIVIPNPPNVIPNIKEDDI